MKGFIGAAALCATLANAWWDGPHVLSGEIATRYLQEIGRGEVVETINKALYAGADLWPCHADISSSVTWLDYAKNRFRATDSSSSAKPDLGYEFLDHLRMWDRFHYYDALYVDPEGVAELGWDENWAQTALDNLDVAFYQNQTLNTLLFALESAETSLWGSNLNGLDKTPWSFAMNIHHVTHLLGDLHMPCHTAALWNYKDHLERGIGMHDEGANYIPIQFAPDACPACVDARITNLHAFWDAMGGYETRNRFDIWGKTDDAVTDIMTQYPIDLLENDLGYEIVNPTILQMMKESFSLEAIPQERYGGYHVYKDVYFTKHFCASSFRVGMDCHSEYCRVACAGTPGADQQYTITKEYVEFAKQASKERIALAGYRLAYRLIKAYEKITPELNERIQAAYNFAKSREIEVNRNSGCVKLSLDPFPVDCPTCEPIPPPVVCTTPEPVVCTTLPPVVCPTEEPVVCTTPTPGPTPEPCVCPTEEPVVCTTPTPGPTPEPCPVCTTEEPVFCPVCTTEAPVAGCTCPVCPTSSPCTEPPVGCTCPVCPTSAPCTEPEVSCPVCPTVTEPVCPTEPERTDGAETNLLLSIPLLLGALFAFLN